MQRAKLSWTFPSAFFSAFLSALTGLVVLLAVASCAAPMALEPIPAPDDVAAIPTGAERTSSGLGYRTLSKGSGDRSPGPTDRVNVHYTGWTTDGEMFDSSVQRGRPSTFGLDEVIAGWTEGLQLMQEGDKFRFWIPQALAYRGLAGRPAGMLVFDVELLKIY